jgi:hypothetical protein
MPAIKHSEAAEKLARKVEGARASALTQIYAELFPETPSPRAPLASEIASHIREGLAGEEIVDLWSVVFPDDRNVWYNEETDAIHFNEEMVGSAD